MCISWRQERLPTAVFWPGEFCGLYSPWGHKEWDTIEQLLLSLHIQLNQFVVHQNLTQHCKWTIIRLKKILYRQRPLLLLSFPLCSYTTGCFNSCFISSASRAYCLAGGPWILRASLVGQTHKESLCNAGDPDSIPGQGRFPGERNDNPLPYSCLENSMGIGAWWATVTGLQRSRHDWMSDTFFFLFFPINIDGIPLPAENLSGTHFNAVSISSLEVQGLVSEVRWSLMIQFNLYREVRVDSPQPLELETRLPWARPLGTALFREDLWCLGFSLGTGLWVPQDSTHSESLCQGRGSQSSQGPGLY